MNIRMINEIDAKHFLESNHQLDGETKFMFLEPSERNIMVEQVQKRIENTLLKDKEAVFVVEVENLIVGYASVIGGRLKQNHAQGFCGDRHLARIRWKRYRKQAI